jgi:hypothetical protein
MSGFERKASAAVMLNTRDFAAELMKHLDVMFASYVALFCFGVHDWWKNPRWPIEVALFVISMIAMPLVYFAAFDGNLVVILFCAPQFYLLVFVACFAWLPLSKKNPISPVPIIVSFAINALGYAWTHYVLHADALHQL